MFIYVGRQSYATHPKELLRLVCRPHPVLGTCHMIAALLAVVMCCVLCVVCCVLCVMCHVVLC